MFKIILHANDGSQPAFKALDPAIAVAQQNAAALHLVCVEEIPQMPEYIEEVREAKGIAARRFHAVVERARFQAEQNSIKLQVHVVSGHPVRMIVDLVDEVGADLLVIGRPDIQHCTSAWWAVAPTALFSWQPVRCWL